ncbi:MAG: YfhO family protein [Melioribacteraceae bacterium]|nr:YfhO family protein [Melioribacteraceae bacterium]
MSKQKKKSADSAKEDTKPFDRIDKRSAYILSVGVLLLLLIINFSPYLFENLRPVGTDIVASKGETNLYLKWQNQTGERALWNPNIFGGMPAYPRITPKIIHFDSLIWVLDKFGYWAFFYFFVGALGIFSLLIYKKIPWQFAVIIAVAFTLLPDWQALLGDGHFTKLRAVMVLPWLILSFNYFINKNNWFGAAVFSFMFTWMFRTQHFQIVFYGILLLLFLFIYPYVKMYLEKEYKKAFSFTLKFAVAIILTVITAAQPFLSMKEYAAYSTRGGNPIKIGDKHITANQTGGVDLDYAVQWSLAPSELLDVFVQRFHGGVSGETYDGDKYPQLKGQQIPGYWGQKPMSGNYNFFGMVLFIFALLAVVKNYTNPFIISLAVFVVFSLLLSFGRHFIGLYELFYYYVPFFSKFRAPAMIANITFIALLILSGFGIKSLFEMKHPRDTKILVSIIGSAVVFIGAILIFRDSYAYTTVSEAGRYEPQTLNLLKDIRKEFLTKDATRQLIILLITGAAVMAFYFRKMKAEIFTVVLLVLVLAELYPANKKAFEKVDLDNEAKVEASVFRENELTKYLQERSSTDRLLVLGREFQSNHYSYFHPTINGYSAIKTQLIQDIIEHSLYNANSLERINWNIINMMNGKYIIADGLIEKNFLVRRASSQTTKQILYENTNALPKAWFVNRIKSFSTPEELVLFMNDTSFVPSNEALVVNNEFLGKGFNGEGNITVEEYNPNELKLNVKTQSQQFMVVSEIYYPAGWKVLINGNEADIHQVNHLLRGVEIPAGGGAVEFVFEPETYFSAVTLSWTGNILIIFMLTFFGYMTFYKNRKKPE